MDVPAGEVPYSTARIGRRPDPADLRKAHHSSRLTRYAPRSTHSAEVSVASFLQEDDGKWSATRLALLLWVVGVLMIWGYSSMRAGQMQEVPETVVTVIGILTTGKVVQRFGEPRAITRSQSSLGGPGQA